MLGVWSAKTNLRNQLALPDKRDTGKGDNAATSGSGGVGIVLLVAAMEPAEVGDSVSQQVDGVVGFNDQSFIMRLHKVSNDHFHSCSVRLLWIVSEPSNLRGGKGDVWSCVIGQAKWHPCH